MIHATRPLPWKFVLALGVGTAFACDDSGTGSPEYSLLVVPSSYTTLPGATAAFNVVIERTNHDGEVALSLTGLPAGTSASFLPASTTGSESRLTLTIDADVEPGFYHPVVHSTSTAGDHERVVTLAVLEPPESFWLTISPSLMSLPQGTLSASREITVVRTDYAGPVALSVTGMPDGITASFDPPDATGNTSTLTLTNDGTFSGRGFFEVQVVGTGTPGTRSAALSLILGGIPPLRAP